MVFTLFRLPKIFLRPWFLSRARSGKGTLYCSGAGSRSDHMILTLRLWICAEAGPQKSRVKHLQLFWKLKLCGVPIGADPELPAPGEKLAWADVVPTRHVVDRDAVTAIALGDDPPLFHRRTRACAALCR